MHKAGYQKLQLAMMGMGARRDRWNSQNARGPEDHDHDHPYPEDLVHFHLHLEIGRQ